MAGENKHVAADSVHVHRQVGGALGAVDENKALVVVGAGDDFPEAHHVIETLQRQIAARLRIPCVVQMDPVSAGPGLETVREALRRIVEREAQVFAFHDLRRLNVNLGDEAELGSGVAVTGGYFSVLGLSPHLGRLLGGAFIVETIFGWPGMGRLTVNAILARHDFILLGLRGQAKTRILRSLVRFLDEAAQRLAGSQAGALSQGSPQADNFLGGFRIQVADHDFRTSLAEKFGDCTAGSRPGISNNSDLIFQFLRTVIVIQTDDILHRSMIPFYLSLCLGMMGFASYVIDGLILQELLQVSRYITGAIIR